MVVTTEIGARQLRELLEEVKAGNEVLLTQNHKPVARLIPAPSTSTKDGSALRVRSLKGHRVLARNISQGDLAEEMFDLK
jgi:prevent-host-death family protein